MIHRREAVAAAILWGLGAEMSLAQPRWPGKPITWVVPFPAGGTTDVLARLLGQPLGDALGVTVVIENRAGAGGSLGSEWVSRAAPDGYTLVGGTISSHAINVSLYPRLGYDPVASFTPVTLIGTNPVVLVVPQSSAYRSLQDILAAGRRHQALNSASAGSGTSQHLALEMLKARTGVAITHIPYKGSGPAIQDVMAGQVDMMFDTTVVAGPYIASGKLRALAVTSAQRWPSLPDVPTVAESGVPGYEVMSWQALFAPAGTPAPIVQRLHVELARILADPAVQDRLDRLGLREADLTVAEIRAFQQAEVAKWAALIRTAGIRLE